MEKSLVLKFLCLAMVFLNSCGSIRNSSKYKLDDDMYLFRQKGTSYQKTWVYVKEDSILITSHQNPEQIIIPKKDNVQFFLKRSFDIDITTVVFKYRPPEVNIPRQLTTDFNGNVYLGYRFDRFKVKKQKTPFGPKQSFNHRGFTGGVFGGIGSTAITPWTTNNMTTDEYSGFVLTRGVAIMIGVNDLTVGVGLGWDYLTDKDNDIWVYQHKPWYGLTVGLNLN